jgi:hypothetical protein
MPKYQTKTTKILSKIIDLMRKEGLVIEDPYDFTNFMEDYATHSHLFETERFEEEDED